MRAADVKLNLQETDYDQFLQDEVRAFPAAKDTMRAVCSLVANDVPRAGGRHRTVRDPGGHDQQAR
jgi:hypothetical protein